MESQDVAEAIRLVREALLSYAIDPLTGKIDMNLINTGKSVAVRERIEEIKNAVKDLVGKKSSPTEYQILLAELKSAFGPVQCHVGNSYYFRGLTKSGSRMHCLN